MTSILNLIPLPNPIPPKTADPPHIVIAAPSFITVHDTTTMISQMAMMPENYCVDLSLCSFPPAEHGIMIKGNMNVLTILDSNLNRQNMLGHNFYHTFIKDQTTSKVEHPPSH